MKFRYFFILLLTAKSSFAATGLPYTDEWLEGRISGAYAYNDKLDSSNLEVDSVDGVVTLTGKTPSEIERYYAEKLASSIEGVKSVKNEIIVDENISSIDKTSIHQKIKDATVTAAIKAKLLANKDVNGLAVNVDTLGDVVTLNGEVNSKSESTTAERLAFSTKGVREVKNNLTLITEENNTSKAKLNESKDTLTAVSDTWVSTKARSILAFDENFNGSTVHVETTNGNVKLTGYAMNNEQKSEIEDVVRNISGVKSINNQIVLSKITRNK